MLDYNPDGPTLAVINDINNCRLSSIHPSPSHPMAYLILNQIYHNHAIGDIYVVVCDDDASAKKMKDLVFRRIVADDQDTKVTYNNSTSISINNISVEFKSITAIQVDGLGGDYDGLCKIFFQLMNNWGDLIMHDVLYEMLLHINDGELRPMIIGITNKDLDRYI